MMINLFKKKQRERKALYEVPDEIFCTVCREYLTNKNQIDRSFPYFMTVLTRKAEEYSIKRHTGGARFGQMAQSIKELFK